MKFEFEIRLHPDSLDAEDAVLNILNDDGLRADVESDLEVAIEGIMRWGREIRVRAKMTKWDVR